MKSFKQFLVEADIKGNPGIPGEGGKREGESGYLSDVEKRAKDRLGIEQDDLSRPGMPSAKEMALGRRLNRLIRTSQSLSKDHMPELSGLITEIIYNLYKDIINRYEIELDIKLVNPGEIKSFMEEVEKEVPEFPEMKDITDPNVIREIHKRKIANLIIQGEAKNTKHLLHTEEIKEGFSKILGPSNGESMFNTLDEIAKIMDQLDWIIPESFRAMMMASAPEGLAGAEKVGWKPKEKKEEEEENKDEYKEEDEEENEYEEERGEGMTPILRARGIDVSILIHESVKGLFEILSLMGLPVVKDEDGEDNSEETKKLLGTIYGATGMGDEPQDWKYGPEIAADLRDFVNQNPDIDAYPNVREELWKFMVDRRTMPTEKFLELMRGILSNTREARIQIDSLVRQVVEKIRIEKQYQDELDQYNIDMEEYERKMKEWRDQKSKSDSDEEPESDIERLVKQSFSNEPSPNIDYSKMSQIDLRNEIDAALDAGDYEKFKALSKFIKEGKLRSYHFFDTV